MKLLFVLVLVTLCNSACVPPPPPRSSPDVAIELVPAKISTVDSIAQFVSTSDGLDGPKVKPINDTVFDWWYFDAIAADGLTSLVITFFTSTSDAYGPRLS